MFRSLVQHVSSAWGALYGGVINGLVTSVTSISHGIANRYLMDVDYETPDDLEDFDRNLLGHYDNLALYKPAKIHIHGLKYDVDYSTDQACFYIQDIDEASECFQGCPAKYLWQSKKTYITLFDESQLPYTSSPKRTYKRTFKRHTKSENEGNAYLLQEVIIHEVNDETNESIRTREHMWKPQLTNTEDTYTLATLVADKIHSREHVNAYIYKKSTYYGVASGHDDYEIYDRTDEDIAFANDPLPGALGHLTYYTEKLIHINEVPKKDSSIDSSGDDSYETDEDIFEADNLNVKVSYGPAIMWMAPYEDRRGLTTSLFQLSEKFGDTYERRVFQLTTDDRHYSDFSLSMSEIRESKQYIPVCNDLEQSLKDMPVDAIVIDAIQKQNENKSPRHHGDTSDSDDFEDLDLSMSENGDHSFSTSTPTHGKMLPIIQVNGHSTPSKSNFRNAGLKKRLANDENFPVLSDANYTEGNASQTNGDLNTFDTHKDDAIVTSVPINGYNDFVECSEDYQDDIIGYADENYNINPTDVVIELPREIDNRNTSDNTKDYFDHEQVSTDNEVENYINGKYGVCDSNDESETPSHEEISLSNTEYDITPVSDGDTSDTSNKRKFSLLQVSRNAKQELQNTEGILLIQDSEVIDYCSEQESEISNDEIDKGNIKVYDAYAEDHTTLSSPKYDRCNKCNGDRDSLSDYQYGDQNDICTCCRDESYYDSIDGNSSISDDCNFQPTLTYPTVIQKVQDEQLCPSDELNSKGELNSFNVQSKEQEIDKFMAGNAETGSDSGFENIQHHQQYSEDEKAMVISSNSDLIISLSSNDDDDDDDDDDANQTDSIFNDMKTNVSKCPVPNSTIDGVGDIIKLINFITSVKEVNKKPLVTEYIDEDINIQWRPDHLDDSEGLLPKQTLLGISIDHKSKCMTTKELSIINAAECISEYLQHGSTLSHKLDADPHIKPAVDMNSFISAVRSPSSNQCVIKHADDESTVESTSSHREANGGHESSPSSSYFKSNSLISFGSEDEYLQLPSENFKPKVHDISICESDESTGSSCDSYEICSGLEIDDESDINCFITSIKNLVTDELRMENPSCEYVADYTDLKGETSCQMNSLLDIAEKYERENYRPQNINSTDSFTKKLIPETNTNSNFSLNDVFKDIKEEVDMDSFVKAIGNLKNTSDKEYKKHYAEGEDPSNMYDDIGISPPLDNTIQKQEPQNKTEKKEKTCDAINVLSPEHKDALLDDYENVTSANHDVVTGAEKTSEVCYDVGLLLPSVIGVNSERVINTDYVRNESHIPNVNGDILSGMRADKSEHCHEEQGDISSIKPSREEKEDIVRSSELDVVTSIPSKYIETMNEYHGSQAQSCTNININDTNDDDNLLDMKSYIIPSRELSTNDPVKQNGRESDLDYVIIPPQDNGIFTECPEIVHRDESITKKEKDPDEANEFLKSFKDHKDKIIQQLRSQMPDEGPLDDVSFQQSDSHGYNINSRDYNTSSASSIMRMNELFGSAATTTPIVTGNNVTANVNTTNVASNEEDPDSSKVNQEIFKKELIEDLVNNVIKDTYEEAKEVGGWVMSINNSETDSENSNEIVPRSYIDVNAEIDFRCNTDNSKSKEYDIILQKDVESSPEHDYACKQMFGNDIQSNQTPNGQNMSGTVDYKPHQLKYGASEDVDHVIVLPNGKMFPSSFERDFLPTTDKNTDTLVEIQPKNTYTKEISSVVSGFDVDMCNDNKNYFLVDDQSKNIIESKQCSLFDDEPPKEDIEQKPPREDIEQKNYFLLNSMPNNENSETFNWYIDDESSGKVTDHVGNNEFSAGEQNHVKQIKGSNKQDSDEDASLPNHRAIRSNETKSDINTKESITSLSIQHSPVKQRVQFVITNAAGKPVNSVCNGSNARKSSETLHIVVKDKPSSPTCPPKSPKISPKSPKINDCRSVLCVQSKPKKTNTTSPYRGEINTFELYDDADENISIYDTKQLHATSKSILGRHSTSWAHGLNSRDQGEYDLWTRACDMTSRDQNVNSERVDVNSQGQSDKSQYIDIDSTDFYFNSRDEEMSHVHDSRRKQRLRSDSADSSPRDGTFFNPYMAYEKSHVSRSFASGYYSMNKRKYGSLDCLYPSNNTGMSKTRNGNDGRRLFAGYSYLSLHSLPPDHEIIRSSNSEQRAKELEMELNFIRSERRKAREEREFDFYCDETKPRKDVGHLVIPEVFENNK